MRVGLALYASALAASTVNAIYEPTQVSRRGLAIANEYLASAILTPTDCERLRAAINRLKAKFASGPALRSTNVDDLAIREACIVGFNAEAGFVEYLKANLASELPDFKDLDKVVFEQDSVVVPEAVASWGLDRIDQASLPLNENFAPGYTGKGVNVYIVDTGVNANHVDFTGRATQAVDFSGEGNVDGNGHGTHCAGTVAGKTFGIASDASIFGVKVLGANGGSNQGVIRGVQWAVTNAAGKSGVISMSLGGGASTALDNAVKQAAQSGMIVVVAAGNENQNACNVSPARAGGQGPGGSVITVGSTTRTDLMSSFSNYGACTDVFAPGSSITSAWIGSTTATNTISGTSMATPHVAGVAAALLEKHNLNKAAAQAELFALVANNKVNNIGPGSPNKMLQVPVGAAATPTVPPTVPPTTPPVPAPTPNPGNGNPGVPAGWTCPAAWYNTNDGCDCGCGAGAVDPDCTKPTTTTLYCRGRGARYWQVCLESSNECVSRWDFLEEGATPAPTFVDMPKSKEGVENGVEYPPPIVGDADPAKEAAEAASFAGATVGIIAGVCAVAVGAALVVVKRRRDSAAAGAPNQSVAMPASYVTSGNPYYGQQQQQQQQYGQQQYGQQQMPY